MGETGLQVIRNRDQSDRNDESDEKKAKLFTEGGMDNKRAELFTEGGMDNNEMDNKRAKLFTGGGMEYPSEPGMVRWTYAVFKPHPSTKPPVSSEDSRKGFYKYLLRENPRPTTGPPIFIWGQDPSIDLNDEENARPVNLVASEAVKEYNNRQFEDKLELVKVTKATLMSVAGFRYDLTFDAKVLADGGGTTKTYDATVWLKIDGTLQVVSFKLTDDGQGKATIPTYIR